MTSLPVKLHFLLWNLTNHKCTQTINDQLITVTSSSWWLLCCHKLHTVGNSPTSGRCFHLSSSRYMYARKTRLSSTTSLVARSSEDPLQTHAPRQRALHQVLGLTVTNPIKVSGLCTRHFSFGQATWKPLYRYLLTSTDLWLYYKSVISYSNSKGLLSIILVQQRLLLWRNELCCVGGCLATKTSITWIVWLWVARVTSV